jgi:hypothetical protein
MRRTSAKVLAKILGWVCLAIQDLSGSSGMNAAADTAMPVGAGLVHPVDDVRGGRGEQLGVVEVVADLRAHGRQHGVGPRDDHCDRGRIEHIAPGHGQAVPRPQCLRAAGQDVHVVTGIDGPVQQVPADAPGGT